MGLTGNYYYLLSSLPYLSFGAPPPISHHSLSERSRPWLDGSALRIFETATIAFQDASRRETDCGTLRSWFEFEHGVRSGLARRRADILGRPEARRPGSARRAPERSLAAVNRAFQANHPLDAEIQLMRARWTFLTELGSMHYFDLPALLIYSLKLQLLERRSTFDQQRGLELATLIYERNIHGGERDEREGTGRQG